MKIVVAHFLFFKETEEMREPDKERALVVGIFERIEECPALDVYLDNRGDILPGGVP